MAELEHDLDCEPDPIFPKMLTLAKTAAAVCRRLRYLVLNSSRLWEGDLVLDESLQTYDHLQAQIQRATGKYDINLHIHLSNDPEPEVTSDETLAFRDLLLARPSLILLRGLLLRCRMIYMILPPGVSDTFTVLRNAALDRLEQLHMEGAKINIPGNLLSTSPTLPRLRLSDTFAFAYPQPSLRTHLEDLELYGFNRDWYVPLTILLSVCSLSLLSIRECGSSTPAIRSPMIQLGLSFLPLLELYGRYEMFLSFCLTFNVASPLISLTLDLHPNTYPPEVFPAPPTQAFPALRQLALTVETPFVEI